MNTKYIWLLIILLGFTACNDVESVLEDNGYVAPEALPELTAGSADFSKYVAIGASFTAGYTDGALFKAAQGNSFPNMLAQQFALIDGGTFTQPLTSDNFGGLAAGGSRLPGFDPRLVFGGKGPVPLESVIGPVTVGTDIFLNNPTGPFTNMGVPGAKSYHLLFNGYGNPANLATQTANPYFIRMASSTSATMLADAMVQNPTFFTLSEIGGNDVLGYALSGGDGSNAITPSDGPPGVGFDQTFDFIVTTLTSGGAKGAITNVPYVKDLPHFTTVPYAPLSPANPAFGPLIPTLNGVFGQLNQVYAYLQSVGAITNAAERSIVFSTTAASAVVIKDETFTNISAQIAGVLNASPTFPAFVQSLGLPIQAAPLVATLLGNAYGQTRQATSADLLVLPSSSVIGTVNTASFDALKGYGLSDELAAQFSTEGITYPLADKWVLLPSEQAEIKAATDAYNATIASVAASKGLALVDLNAILTEATTNGYKTSDYTLTTDLVVGGLVSLDGIHLTGRGYALMANEFLRAIDATYGSNFEASGNVANAGDYPTNYPPLLP